MTRRPKIHTLGNQNPKQNPWEMGEDRRQDFGIGLCKLALAIDRSVAKEV